MRIQESGENYLETILILQGKNGFVRAIDVATEMNFTKASVSRALGILKREKFITVKENGQILFTKKGRERAGEIYDRHRVLSGFLTDVLGVPKNIADDDACHIEHVISKETFDAIKNFKRT